MVREKKGSVVQQKKKKANKERIVSKGTKKTARKEWSGFSETTLGYAVLLLTLIGFGIRVMNLGALTLWVDEYVHVTGMQDFFAGEGSIFVYDGNGSLYNFLMYPFVAIFGVTEFWSRFPSVLCGAACIYLTYLLGKTLFNERVGIYAALLITGSLYMVFWSRVARNYSIFSLTYLAAAYVFFRAFEPLIKEEIKNSFWSKFAVDKKYLLAFPLVFFLAFASHKLALFMAFSIGFYCIFRMIMNRFTSQKIPVRQDKYFYLSIPAILFFILFFTPALGTVVKSIVGQFIPASFVNWFIPAWSKIGELWATKPYEVFNIYKNLVFYDQPYLVYAGIAGLGLSFFYSKRSGFFLFSFFVVPLALMSFVLREVYNPRYFIYLYPFLLIAVGVIIAFNVPYQSIIDLMTAKEKSGFVVNKRLTSWSFTNWKEPIQYVQSNMKDGDVVMGTITSAVNYYLGFRDACVQFRQKRLDRNTKTYVNIDAPASNLNAQTIDNLKRTIESHPRGWLIANYYFDNILTDPKAKDVVFKNMHYHFDASSSGDIEVYSWDHSQPKPQNQDLVEVVGRKKIKGNSKELKIKIRKAPTTKQFLLEHYCQGVGQDEAILILNKKYQYILPPNKGNGIEPLSITVPASNIINGVNTVQYVYNQDLLIDARKGFSIHSLLGIAQ